MKVKCPTCGKETEYSPANRWRPFCSERCKLIDLGQWASEAYVIKGAPGSADPDVFVEQLEKLQREQEEADEKAQNGRRHR